MKTITRRISRLEQTRIKPAEALQIIVVAAPGMNSGFAMLSATGKHVIVKENETEPELIERVKNDHPGAVKSVAVLMPEDLRL